MQVKDVITINFNIKHWNELNYKEFINYLISLQDIKYKKFNSNLLPGTNNIIGIRYPILKKIAKEISYGEYNDFLKLNQHKYYEECLIHGFIISNLKLSIENIIDYINRYLPYINNWGTCDSFCSSLHIVKNNKETFFKYINELINNDNEWIKRFCFVTLLNYYIDDNYLPKIFNLCDKYNNDKYYVNMAVAWLISICYIKYKNITLKYLHNNSLDKFTYNKAIQKIIESKRISKDEKIKLKLLKI